MKKVIVCSLLSLSFVKISAQKPAKDWYLQNQSKKVNGISLDKTYEFLKTKTPTPIIVAVIDGGTDIQHEDLKDILWHNANEIPFNNIDDDKNGYVDDTVGWNFIGGANGDLVTDDNLEIARLVKSYNNKFENMELNDISTNPSLNATYIRWQTLKTKLGELIAEATQNKETYENVLGAAKKAQELTGLDNPNASDIISACKKAGMEDLGKNLAGIMGDNSFLEFEKNINENLKHFEEQLKFQYNIDFDTRATIVKDDYLNPKNVLYGNNNVEGPNAEHGSHVSGIIAANRKNNVGINGISNVAKIMTIRVVPNGDERDKDVANGIRYAVDNGAKIINMSFGKAYSFNKQIVNDAVQYAISKNVLLVHAAGNDGKNTDIETNYPNDSLGNNTFASNWIEVGASALSKKTLATDFSNYGKHQVDIFSPGFQIYSSTINNNYEYFNGTSMAAPVLTGVAALVWSYYPQLTVNQIKQILLTSGVEHKQCVLKPNEEGKKEKIKFAKLSQTGRVVNAYKAIIMASEMVK